MSSLLAPTNYLFALARLGKRLTPLLATLALALVFMFGSSFVVGVIVAVVLLMFMPTSMPDVTGALQLSAAEYTVFLVASFAPILLLVWAWIRLYEQRPFWTLGFERSGAARRYGTGLLAGALMFSAAVGIMALPGYIVPEGGDPRFHGTAALGGVIVIAIGWIVQGAAEEVLCRGWLLQTIGARYRPWLGIVVSSLIFMLLHSFNPNLSLIALLNLFLFGMFAALYALYEGGLWGVCALHSVWNWVQGNVFGLAVSGGNFGNGSIFNLTTTGPEIITGGAFGPEGGLAVTAVLLAGIGVIALLAQRGLAVPQGLTEAEQA